MPVLAKHYPPLDELFLRYGSPPIRNAGTLGGNVANGSPIGDSMPPLLALNATLTLRKGERRRELPLDQFYLGYQQTALEAGEFLQSVRVPLPNADLRFGVYKVSKRFDQDISAVCGAFAVQVDGSATRKTIADARIAFGGMAAVPLRARRAEAALIGHELNEATIETAAAELADDYSPISDMRASADYRLRVCGNLLKRFYVEVASGERQGVYSRGRA